MPADRPPPETAASARAFCLRAAARVIRVEADDTRPPWPPGDDGDAVLHEAGAGMVVAYEVQEGGEPVLVRWAHLRAAGLAIDDLHANAVHRLARLAEQRTQVQRFGHLFMVSTGGGLEASLVLCDAFWDEWRAGVSPGGIVAAIPAADVLAFGEASSTAAIRELDDLCTRIAPAADHPLSDRLFRRVGGRWEALPEDGA